MLDFLFGKRFRKAEKRIELLEAAVRGFRRAGEPMFVAYLKNLQVLTPTALQTIRSARRALDQAKRLVRED